MNHLHPVEVQAPVGIRGVPVYPGDVIVADEDGAIVRILPRWHAVTSSRSGEFVAIRSARDRITGTYPPNAARLYTMPEPRRLENALQCVAPGHPRCRARRCPAVRRPIRRPAPAWASPPLTAAEQRGWPVVSTEAGPGGNSPNGRRPELPLRQRATGMTTAVLGYARMLAVRLGDQLEQMAVGVFEVDAAAAPVMVDLAGAALVGSAK